MTYRPVHDPTHPYFITATVLGWKRVFAKPAHATIILDSLAWHRENGRWQLYAYVVMPNHMHALIKPCEGRTISDVLQSFGSFTAHAILTRLTQDGCEQTLGFFAAGARNDTDRSHRVWQPIQAANVVSPEFLIQKVEYIHHNPIADNWRLVGDRADYAYSSACYYDRGETPVVEVDNAWDLLG